MALDYQTESPEILRDYLSYHENIKMHSSKTVDEYFLDLRLFFRYVKLKKAPELCEDIPFDALSILDVNLAMLATVTASDIMGFLTFLSKRQGQHGMGLNAKSKARKQASLRSFYNYLCSKAKVLEQNPTLVIDAPKQPKTLPQFLTEDECNRLLDAVSGPFATRDYCIILLFLTCGIRISELVGINIPDIREGSLRIRGKGNKERMLYLSESCMDAIEDYLEVRDPEKAPNEDKDALFLSRNFRRINPRSIQKMLDKTLLLAGLDVDKYSPHKLRHSAATLMLQNGVDVRTLQDVLGHENLNTTQIYTHVDSEGLRVAAKANPLSRRKKREDDLP